MPRKKSTRVLKYPKILEMWEAGHTAPEIAQALGTTANAVYMTRYRYAGTVDGASRPRPNPRAPARLAAAAVLAGRGRGGHPTVLEAAAAHDVKVSSVYMHLNRLARGVR